MANHGVAFKKGESKIPGIPLTEKSARQVAGLKPVKAYGMEEIAAEIRVRPTGGVLFARTAGEEKYAARQRVVELFQPHRWPGRLHMLTMPAVQWRFERLLLGAREVGWMQRSKPRRTFFTSIENDRAIYYSSVTQIPGLSTPNAVLKKLAPFSFAEMGVKTRYASFFFADIDDFMAQDWDASGWDAAWLDYTGPLSVKRLDLIRQFYSRYIHHVLIVTALKARWDRRTAEAIAKAGDYMGWLRSHLEGEVLHELEYFDSSPMAQYAVRKHAWKSPLI